MEYAGVSHQQRRNPARGSFRRSREIEKQRALNEGKPEQVAENIARGRVQKGYIQKVALLEQLYYRDESKTIGALLKEKGADITVQRFCAAGSRQRIRRELWQISVKSYR